MLHNKISVKKYLGLGITHLHFLSIFNLIFFVSHLVPLNLNFLFTRETHQINNPLGRPVNFCQQNMQGQTKKIQESERPLCSAASRKNFVNEENLLEKLCGTRNSESLSNSVDQLGEIQPLANRGKFHADIYKRYIRIQRDSFLVKW